MTEVEKIKAKGEGIKYNFCSGIHCITQTEYVIKAGFKKIKLFIPLSFVTSLFACGVEPVVHWIHSARCKQSSTQNIVQSVQTASNILQLCAQH